jgi:hypothetical protein
MDSFGEEGMQLPLFLSKSIDPHVIISTEKTRPLLLQAEIRA